MTGRHELRVGFAVAYLCLASALSAQDKSAVDERLISMPPCRLVDTRVTRAKDPGEESRRRVDVAPDRCGKIVPNAATAYAIRVTRLDRTVDGPPPGAAPLAPILRFPATAPIEFPIGASEHITVDLEGYYVPSSAITEPGAPPNSSVKHAMDGNVTDGVAGGMRPLSPRSDANPTGPYGDILLDASDPSYYNSGILAVAKPAKPWAIMKSGDSGGGGGFAFFNSNNAELLRVASNGPLRLATNTYFSGRSDYREAVSPVDNVFNQVKVLNPRDAAGGSASRVTFFNARSDDEYGSPATTKFQAFTLGYYNQADINFDSQIAYHWPGYNKYHFRAYSTIEQKETFWVKAATNFDSYSQTRADMYVSGRVGVGSAAPRTLLHLARDAAGAIGPELVLENNANSVGDAEAITFAANGFSRAQIRSRVEASPYYGTLEFATGLTSPVERMRITGAGDVGIGTATPSARLHVVGNIVATGSITGASVIGAIYQDLAEWVPATSDMEPGTVVVLNPERNNEVMPSHFEYDTTVAGVVSAMPGIILGVAGESKEQIATTGRVKVRVDARIRAVAVGDLLVTSDTPGTAMRSEPMEIRGRMFHQPGTIIGKALEPLAAGEGEILVLLSLQ